MNATNREASSPMENKRRSYVIIATCLAITVVIGFVVILFPLNGAESDIISNLQSLAQQTVGIGFFSVVTYLGDFYLLAAFSAIFLIYAYFKSPKWLNTSKQLMGFLILVNVSTLLLKIAFARPRPSGANFVFYGQEDSFSYPSGHVSRTTGTFIILSGDRSTFKIILILTAGLLVSLSRVILGVHYLTDTIGAVFLSLSMDETTKLAVSSLNRPLIRNRRI
ncbi:MAG: phosphatase PAP2 family protein [Candidatus Bathyarchaeota archaeon]